MNDLAVYGGSITGRMHLSRGELLIGKNNQDGYAWTQADDFTICVVTDGCSEGQLSEVGARLAPQILLRLVSLKLKQPQDDMQPPISDPNWWESIRVDLLTEIDSLAKAMTPPGENYTLVMREFFLFTVIIALITSQQAVVVSIGDGLFAVNGTVTRLGPFPRNEPPYATYALVKTSFPQDSPLLRFQVQACVAREELTSLLIGSDGVGDLIQIEDKLIPGTLQAVGPLEQFWQDQSFLANADAVRRKLALINSTKRKLNPQGQLETQSGLLPDDTTLIVVRHKEDSYESES